jgi:hypothetical protein
LFKVSGHNVKNFQYSGFHKMFTLQTSFKPLLLRGGGGGVKIVLYWIEQKNRVMIFLQIEPRTW